MNTLYKLAENSFTGWICIQMLIRQRESTFSSRARISLCFLEPIVTYGRWPMSQNVKKVVYVTTSPSFMVNSLSLLLQSDVDACSFRLSLWRQGHSGCAQKNDGDFLPQLLPLAAQSNPNLDAEQEHRKLAVYILYKEGLLWVFQWAQVNTSLLQSREHSLGVEKVDIAEGVHTGGVDAIRSCDVPWPEHSKAAGLFLPWAWVLLIACDSLWTLQ